MAARPDHTIITHADGSMAWSDGTAYDSSKPFRCNWDGCEKSFSRLTYVNRHAKLVHEGIRSHVCQSCGQGFGRSDVLNVHRKTCKGSPAEDGDDVTVNPAPAKRARTTAPRKPFGSTAKTFTISYACSNCAAHGYACDGRSTCSTCTGLGVVCLPAAGPAPPSRDNSGSSQAPSPPSFADFQSAGPSYFDGSREQLSGSPSMRQQGLYQTVPMASTLAPLMSPTLARITGMYPPSPPDRVPSLDSSHGSSSPSSGTDSPPVLSNDAELAMQLMPLTPSAILAPGADLNQFPFPPGLEDLLTADRVMNPSPLEFMDPTIYDTSYLNDTVDPSRPFALDPSKFVGVHNYYRLGTGFELPKASRLADWANLASQSLLDALPILHLPTFDSQQDSSVNFSFAVMGAAAMRHQIAAARSKSLAPPLEPGSEMAQPAEFVDTMLARKRGYLVADFARRYSGPAEEPVDEKDAPQLFSLIRSMLIYQLSGLGHEDDSQRAVSESFHASLIAMARRYGLIRRASRTDAVAVAGTASNEERWRQWVAIETERRICWILHLADLAIAARGVRLDSFPLMCFSDMDDVPLPSSDMLWSAKDAETWAFFDAMVGSAPMPPIIPVLRHLMTAKDGESYTPGPMCNLAASVVGRALAFFANRVHVQDCLGLRIFGLEANAIEHNRAVVERAQDRLEALTCLERGQATIDLLRLIRKGEESWLGNLGGATVVEPIV